ncbi:type IV toxin-antitoxin system AbiEi family antitoxin domain-containing protein [Phytoactinopolyspora mesophila]|nr:type IV toxin-antitoxin system AbiEi family antitoxin domain-containing protein [Phytoactinopolyspora mesophila]
MLNQLQRELPEGLVVDAAWLERHGYYRSLRQTYVNHGWLERAARRVYRRPGPELSWEQVVISLQTLLEYPVAVGGRTALELGGLAHYVPRVHAEVHLHRDRALPTWLPTLQLPQRLIDHRNTRLFDIAVPELTSSDLSAPRTDGDVQAWARGGFVAVSWGQWNWPLMVSTPERAVLELLDELPARESFHQADVLFEGMVALSPRRVQHLLERCKSVKVKRLFFFFADRYSHAWLARIDRAKVNLGSGKRALVPGGRLDSTYNITVPEDLYAV